MRLCAKTLSKIVCFKTKFKSCSGGFDVQTLKRIFFKCLGFFCQPSDFCDSFFFLHKFGLENLAHYGFFSYVVIYSYDVSEKKNVHLLLNITMY